MGRRRAKRLEFAHRIKTMETEDDPVTIDRPSPCCSTVLEDFAKEKTGFGWNEATVAQEVQQVVQWWKGWRFKSRSDPVSLCVLGKDPPGTTVSECWVVPQGSSAPPVPMNSEFNVKHFKCWENPFVNPIDYYICNLVDILPLSWCLHIRTHLKSLRISLHIWFDFTFLIFPSLVSSDRRWCSTLGCKFQQQRDVCERRDSTGWSHPLDYRSNILSLCWKVAVITIVLVKFHVPFSALKHVSHIWEK